jgi:hypothetical protein
MPQQKNGKPAAHRSKRGRSEILDGRVSTGRKMRGIGELTQLI